MTSPQPESLRILTRQDAHLQAHLQELLDAQSEGLLAGLGADPRDTASSTSSRTPTASESGVRNSSKPRSVIPVRQPKLKKIGLRSARRGISRTIRQLSQIKDEEARVLQDEIDQRDGSLSRIQSLSSKEQGLREAITNIQAESPTARIADLKATEKELGNEIYQLETRLFEMKARQRHLMREIQATENGVQSKLSSYKNALQLAENEARSFLARPPLQAPSQKGGFWALPPQRRTLELAKEQFQEEQNGFGRHIEGLVVEKQALDEGGSTWEDVVREVGGLETMLQGEMQDLNSNHGKRAEGGMRRILERMRDAQRHIEELLRVAEEKDWKLLVCCIGAELEALVEGQSVLGEALEASGAHLDKASASESQNEGVFIDEPSPSITGVNGRLPDEDDGPGPDLLISQEDV